MKDGEIYSKTTDSGTAYTRFAHICACIRKEGNDYIKHFKWRDQEGDIEPFDMYMEDTNHDIQI